MRIITAYVGTLLYNFNITKISYIAKAKYIGMLGWDADR